MSFVYPQFLWALLALAIPIIIHLFNFRKYKTLYFSSLQFVQHVEQRSKSTQKLKNLIILIMRVLAFIAIIIAFAQPYFGGIPDGQNLGKDVLAIHIDNSYSMTMKGAEGELLSEAKESARKILNQAPLNARIMLSTNGLDGIESRLTTKVDALDRLEKIVPSPMVRSFDEVINWQKNNLKNSFELNDVGNVQHIYLSDFQKSTTKFGDLKSDDKSFYFPIVVSPQNKSNLSIDSVWFSSPLHKVGLNKELNIKLTNNSPTDVQNVQLNFELESKKRDLFVDIPANSSSIAVMNYTDKNAGLKFGKLMIQDKQFYADDEYHFTYEVAKQSKILIVNGESANTSVGNIYRLDNFYAVNEISQGQYTQDMLDGTNLVVLNGINEIPSGLNAGLTDFWNNGGTVALFPGANLQMASVNSFLSSVKLPIINKLIGQNARINKLNYKDPFFTGVFEKEKDNLSLPAVSKFYLTSESMGTNALNVIQLQNGKPLFVRSDGDKQAFLFASVLSSDFGSITSDILFTTLLLRIGELSLRDGPIAITIGESTKYPIYQKINSEKPIHLVGKNVDFIPKSERNNGVTYIDLSGTEAISQLKAGVYSIVGDKELGKIALNYNRKESKIDPLEKGEILDQLAERGIKNTSLLEVSEGASVSNLQLDEPYPYWKIFLILTLLFLIAEIAVIKLWNQKLGKEMKAQTT